MIPPERKHLFAGIAPTRRDVTSLLRSLADKSLVAGYVQINGQNAPAFKTARACTNFIAMWVASTFASTARSCECATRSGERDVRKLSLDRLQYACELASVLQKLDTARGWVSPKTSLGIEQNLQRLEAAIARLPASSTLLQCVAGYARRYCSTSMKVSHAQ